MVKKTPCLQTDTLGNSSYHKTGSHFMSRDSWGPSGQDLVRQVDDEVTTSTKPRYLKVVVTGATKFSIVSKGNRSPSLGPTLGECQTTKRNHDTLL